MQAASSWTHPAYGKVAKLMETKTGLVFLSNRYADVEAGTRKAMARMDIPELEQYLQILETETSFQADLAGELTVGETYFFREPEQFQRIREEILPEIVGRRGREYPLKVWSAGCSSGEEAYSLAILLEEEGLEKHANIQATDISKPALRKAREAVYGPWSLRGRKDDWIKRYLKPEGEGFALAPRFRQRVEFQYQNLAVDHYPAFSSSLWGMDLILCRNVMIYFSPAIVAAVFQKLTASLASGGWLVTGPSDPLFEERSGCEMFQTQSGTVYRKGHKTDPPTIPFPWETPRIGRSGSSAGPQAREKGTAEILPKAQEAFDRMEYGQVLHLTQAHLKEPAVWQLYLKALANLQGTSSAEQAAERAVRLHPLSPELHFLRAVLLMNMGRNRDAVRDLRRTLYLDPTLAVAEFAMGSVLRRLADRKGANRAFQNVLRLCEESPSGTILPLSDGESAGQLREAAQNQLLIPLGLDPEHD